MGEWGYNKVMKKLIIILFFYLIISFQSTAKVFIDDPTHAEQHFQISGYDIKLYSVQDEYGSIMDILHIYKNGELLREYENKGIDIKYIGYDINFNGNRNLLVNGSTGGSNCGFNEVVIYEFRPQEIKEVHIQSCGFDSDMFYTDSNQLIFNDLERWSFWENHCNACSPATKVQFFLDENLNLIIAKDLMTSWYWIEEIDRTMERDCEATKVENQKGYNEDFVNKTFWSSMLKYYFAGLEDKAKEFYDSCWLWDTNKKDEYFNIFLETLESSSNWRLFKN